MKKVVLITGASAGIGMETAKFLKQNGYIVYGAARRTGRLKELEQSGVKTLVIDVTKDESMVKGVQQIIDAEGRIDVLVNNAGFGSYGAVEDVTMDDARYQLEVNVIGAMRMTQLVLPYMRKQHYGKIINVSSIGGKIATPFGGWYHASKFAIEGLSDSLRNEVRPFGIDVIVIEPGGIKSEWGGIAMDSLEKVSGDTAYKDTVARMGKSFREVDGKMPGPDIIAKLIKKGIEAGKPETRYSAGYMAKPALFFRRILSDRLMDKMMLAQMK
ncbi:MAG TPA: oxidoreductase [Mucilaginibacter sp.]|jgi:short-subunit dehydrogenase|nr:oxidoreductase [Mucilaginibacter sp.]